MKNCVFKNFSSLRSEELFSGLESDVVHVGTKGVSQNHLLSFDDNKVLKIINWIC